MHWFLVKNASSSYTEALQMYKEARAPRDYKREYAQYHSKPEQIDNRSTRNKARRKLGLGKGDPREVDHKVPLSKGGSNGRNNLRAVSLVENRKKFTKTASTSYKDLSEKEKAGLGAAALGAGIGLSAQHINPNFNIGTQVYSRLKKPDLLEADVALTEDQIQTLNNNMSPSTRILTYDEIREGAKDRRNPNKRITDAELDSYLKTFGEYHTDKDVVIAHRNRKNGTSSGHILAHELGHANVHNKPVIGKLMRVAPAIGSAGLALGGPAAILAGTEEGTLENRLGNAAQYGGVLATAPKLIDEGYANIKGYRELKRLGLSPEDLAKSRKGLASAMGSYVANAAPTVAAPFIIRKAKRSYDEKKKNLTKTAAIPSPPIDNYTGRWTTVGSGRLGITTPGVSDVDYMVPVEDLESTEGFSPFQQYTSAYKKDFDMPGYRGGSIVALPEGPYKTIDDSYAAASKKYTPKQLRSMKESKDKIDFYRDIGVVLTDDAMKLHNKTANDNRERTYAEMRDAIRGFAAKQNIDPEKAMLVAGGAGYMHGMRDEVNDLDFFHDDLPDFVQEPYGRFDMDGGPGKDLPESAKQYQMMHGMRVQTPESMLAFYQRLNRPKDQEKIEMLKAHLKTASDRVRHTIVTGHSGSGKSTLSRKLSKETGLPIYAMDDDPGIRDAFFNYQKTYAKTHDGRLDLSPERRALEDEIERRGIRKALELATPHIIEGSHFLRRKPEEFKEHKLIMVNPSAETIAFQRTNRKKLKDLARGREWNPDIERQSRFRGQQLYDMYEEGGRADNWRKSSLVEKRASTKHHLITGVPGAGKSTVAKRIAEEKGLPLFEIDSDPRFKRALQLIDEGKMSESNALQRQMFRDAVARKDPHVIEGAQVMLDPALARQHELQILDDSADVLAPRWAKREAGKHVDRALRSGRKPSKDEAYYDRLYRDTVYPRYQKQLKGLRSKNL